MALCSPVVVMKETGTPCGGLGTPQKGTDGVPVRSSERAERFKPVQARRCCSRSLRMRKKRETRAAVA